MNFIRKLREYPLPAVLSANFLVYCSLAFYYVFVPIYIRKFHSFSQVGFLLSIGPFIAIFAPLFWGKIADKAKSKNTVLIVLLTGCGVAFFGVSFNTLFHFPSGFPVDFSFFWLVLMLSAIMFFSSPFSSLLDVITLDYAVKTESKYGTLRLLGTIGYGILCFVIGMVADKSEYGNFYLYLVVTLLAVISVSLMPASKGYARGMKKVSLKPLFHDKTLLLLLLFLIAGQFIFGFYQNFYTIYMSEELKFPGWSWGLVASLQPLGEVPFFLLFHKVYKKFSLQTVMLAGLAAGIVRYAALGMAVSIPLVILINIVTGLLQTILLYSVVLYLNDTIAPEMKATGQTFIYSFGVFTPKILSGFLGGVLSQSMGIKNTLFFCSGISVLFTILILIFPIKYKLKK
ncbi:MAG: hypothetical protein BGN88_13625 [Clostridiales bacterium 43-6]|nr:MAG: hypothetical protein BGN88_13625 [Clostridiales bacterium 43-6]